jgi:dihydropteroate synthase
MGVINITPDSFSDGGKFLDPDKAIERSLELIRDGADILDLGAETTRPGSSPTSEEEEWRRLYPVLLALKDVPDCPPISVDTYKSKIAEKAILEGAGIINDIYAGRKDPAIFKVAKDYDLPIILMHMLGEPGTMQNDPHYEDVVKEVRAFLEERANAAINHGVKKNRIILDPGLGFGKNADHNLTLLKKLPELYPEGFISLMALSRKAFLGKILPHSSPEERDEATAVASSLAVFQGAMIVRVHNVLRAAEALKVTTAILRGSLL